MSKLPDIRNRIIETTRFRLGDVRPHPSNWKVHPTAQRRLLQALLREVGWCSVPLAYRSAANDGALTWVDGHLRSEEAPDLEVEVAIVDLDDDEVLKVLLTLDPLAGMAVADNDALAAILPQVQADEEAVREALGRLASELDEDLERVIAEAEEQGEENESPDRGTELMEQWETERGQVWVIPSLTAPGRSHRLMCGDSTSPADVGRLMAGERAVLFATDPPYLVDYDGMNHPSAIGKESPTKNKDWSGSYSDWDRAERGSGLYNGFISAAREAAITEHAAWYCWYAIWHHAMLEQVWQQHGAFVHQQIVWAKSMPVLTRSWYMWQHEPCLFGWIKGKQPRRMSDDHLGTIWQMGRSEISKDHPTSKPVELFAIPIRQHTLAGEVCYEPFAGSGTQILAAESLGRLCYAMELAPQFVAVILERLVALGLEPRPESS